MRKTVAFICSLILLRAAAAAMAYTINISAGGVKYKEVRPAAT